MMKSPAIVAGVVAMLACLGSQGQAQPASVTSTALLLLEREAAELIEQVEEAGRDVQYHANQAERLAGNPEVSRWTHYHHLEGISYAVNRSLRPSLKRLLDAQDQLPGWKQESINRMIAAAQLLSADTSSAIFHKVENPLLPATLNEEYRQLIREIAVHAESLVKTADAARTYARARVKADEAGLAVTR